MHHVPSHQTAVTLFGVDGSITHFPSKKAALKALGLAWIRRNVGLDFRVFSHCTHVAVGDRLLPEAHYARYLFLMRDDCGAPLLAQDFESLVERSRWRPRAVWRLEAWNGEGPVPGTRCWRGGGRYFRRMHTNAERRQAAAWLPEEGERPPRPSRNVRNLPTSWDDRPISARENRSWKRHRRTQYKIVAIT